MKRVILMPVFDDWDAAWLLIEGLDAELRDHQLSAAVLLVDDGSPRPPPAWPARRALEAIVEIRVLRLRRNLGHQRAIAVGLSYLEAEIDCDEILVMDADGEDRPRDVPRMIATSAEHQGTRLIFAERRSRSEGLAFRLSYSIYRSLHRLLTGHRVRFGNFSLMPMDVLRRLVSISELWNHYPAAIIKARIPFLLLPTHRGKRLDGKSHMSFQSLVMHGLSALSVFAETVGLRLMLTTGVFLLLNVALLLLVIMIRLFTDLAIPGWASTVGGILLVMLLQSFVLLANLVFVTLHGRSTMGTIPSRDYVHFVLDATPLYQAPGTDRRPGDDRA